tara:strand:+ start:5751 stop:6605 length:855 start_codon:yes stop_codon:yes gene_type:complete
MFYFSMISCSSLGHRNYGRFGNQIFQYSLCKVLSILHDSSFFVNPDSHFLNFFDSNSMSYKKTDTFDSNQYVEKDAFNFDANILDQKDINLIGFFQNLSYYEKLLPEIRQELRPNKIILNKSFKYIKDKIKTNNLEDTACIHARRGDYENLQNFYDILDINYFEYIIEKIKPKYLFIISDNIQKIKQEFQSIKNNIFLEKCFFVEELDVYQEFYIMYLCRHGIISNSSFSWWSKILSNEKNDKMIYLPYPWLKTSSIDHQSIKLYPKNSIKINKSQIKWRKLFN